MIAMTLLKELRMSGEIFISKPMSASCREGTGFRNIVFFVGFVCLALTVGHFALLFLFKGSYQDFPKSVARVGMSASLFVFATTYSAGQILKYLRDLRDLFSRILNDLVFYRFEPIEAEEEDYEEFMHDLGMSFIILDSLDKMDEERISEILGNVRHSLHELKDSYYSIKDQKDILVQKENLRKLERALRELIEQIDKVMEARESQLVKEEQLEKLEKVVENLGILRSGLADITDKEKRLLNATYIEAKSILLKLVETLKERHLR
jgi:hypothetical protein